MTEEQIREAGAQAVADFPPMPDDVAAHVGRLLVDLNETEEVYTGERQDRAA